MPIRSKAQEKWMWANKPAMARRWEKETSDRKSLPEYVGKLVGKLALLGKKMAEHGFSVAEAKRIERIKHEHVDPKKLAQGMNVELEHRKVTHGNALPTAQIALDHLHERPDYYNRLEIVEGKMPMVGKLSEIPLIGKASNGGGPSYPYGRQTLPDYQLIYNVTPDKRMQRQEAKEAATRRQATNKRNNGKFGFHGAPPAPKLHAEESSFLPYVPTKAGNLKTKPTVLPPVIFKRRTLNERDRLSGESKLRRN